ncbi:acyl dehydratase, partial [Streptomyces sp. MCAF7]
LQKVAIRLGAPNYPGDEMVLTGQVTAVTDGTAEVSVTGRNGIGNHVMGKVTVRLSLDFPASATDSPQRDADPAQPEPDSPQGEAR